MQVDFYQIGAPIERVLPQIAERLLADDERLLVVAEGEELLERLDGALWSYAPESFLPHGRAGADSEEEQPVLLSDIVAAGNGARNVALADGTWREEALAFDRAFHLFGAGEIQGARATWRELAARDGVERRYWRQDEAGRWTQAA